tara:strand:+ start:760 stop:2058 length:1299 start_codon:yes stop_codon:yes gene_type:complete
MNGVAKLSKGFNAANIDTSEASYIPGDNAKPYAQKNLRILVVDDNPGDRELYEQFLVDDSYQGYEFVETAYGMEAINLCSTQKFDCILLDYNLPDLNGIQFLSLLENNTKVNTPVIMLTGQGDETIASDALRAGASDYLPKRAVSTESLKRTINNAVEKFHLRAAVESQTHKLQKNNEELTHKHDEIQRFYQTVSHELKTPLTSMKEFISIILDGLAGPINQEQKTYLELVGESCMQMANGINDLLDITRLETGKYSVELEPNEIKPLIEKTILAMSVIAKHKQIEIDAYFDDSLPEVYMDPGRIEQVLTNLINNAIKFSDRNGKILIKTTIDGIEAKFIRIAVLDNGCGINKDNLKHVFDRLYQVDPEGSSCHESSSTGGLGLGLNICKQLVQLHDGMLKVKSKVGVGSEFSFTLPVYYEETGIHSIIKEI